MSNFDPDARWYFDRRAPVSTADYGWYGRLASEESAAAPDSVGLTFGPAAGPEADDPDDPDCARIYDLIFDAIFFVTGWTGDVDGPAGEVLS